MHQFLSGKVALVTGGSKGIGKAIAHALKNAGATVWICGRSETALREAQTEFPDLKTLVCDVADAEQVKNALQQIGELDILINNAGIGIFKSVSELTIEDWRQTIDVNLSGIFHCSHYAIPAMRRRGGGSIINIGSLAGRNPFANGAAYNASKFAVNGFSEAMMLDHRNEGIRVTAVCPGSVDTDFSPRSGSAPWKIQPEDVAQVVMSVLQMPERTLVSLVEMRPSQPPSKK
jgi:3-oxoacyl-[acyl-carrier protein] reductase